MNDDSDVDDYKQCGRTRNNLSLTFVHGTNKDVKQDKAKSEQETTTGPLVHPSALRSCSGPLGLHGVREYNTI